MFKKNTKKKYTVKEIAKLKVHSSSSPAVVKVSNLTPGRHTAGGVGRVQHIFIVVGHCVQTGAPLNYLMITVTKVVNGTIPIVNMKSCSSSK